MSRSTEDGFLNGGGEAGAAIRAFDWIHSPLGSPKSWPTSLKVSTGLMLNSLFPQAIVWGESLTTLHNDAFKPILGEKPPALGRPFSEVWNEAWPVIGPIAMRAFAGQPTYIEDFPLTINRHGHPEQACFTFCYSPIPNENGRVCGFLDTVTETTDKVRTEQRSTLLNSELAHRLQNTLATVQSIALHTYRFAGSVEAGERSFNERIFALGRAHSLLTQRSWTPAPIHSVVASALVPAAQLSHRIQFSGPELELSANQSLKLSIAISELATNALKYGALSDGAGRVEIEWSTGDAGNYGEFQFVWTERDGPPVQPPTRTGFGTYLIRKALAGEFNGSVDISYAPQGLRVLLRAPMSELVDR
jgi:two-component sensor histidine kinase